MTEKKKHKQEEEFAEKKVEESQTEAVATSEHMEQLSAEIDVLKKKLEEAEARTSEYNDSCLRSHAELQNYRKRL